MRSEGYVGVSDTGDQASVHQEATRSKTENRTLRQQCKYQAYNPLLILRVLFGLTKNSLLVHAFLKLA